MHLQCTLRAIFIKRKLVHLCSILLHRDKEFVEMTKAYSLVRNLTNYNQSNEKTTLLYMPVTANP